MTVQFKDIRDGQCRWIETDPHESTDMCGKPTLVNSSWCEEHHARAFNVKATKEYNDAVLRRAALK